VADTLTRIVGPAAISGTWSTFYTVPASTKTVVRNIHVTNTTSGAIQFSLAINGTAAANQLYSAFVIPGAGTLDWSGFLVLAAADTLRAASNLNTALTITVSGVESA
jgi:hypothetical protein